MRAVVLVKQVPDLRLGGVGVRADGTIDRAAAAPITNPADLHALEAALQLADDVCAALVKYHKIPVYAKCGVNKKEFYKYMDAGLAYQPQLVLDDGGDVVSLVTRQPPSNHPNIIGATGGQAMVEMSAPGLPPASW